MGLAETVCEPQELQKRLPSGSVCPQLLQYIVITWAVFYREPDVFAIYYLIFAWFALDA